MSSKKKCCDTCIYYNWYYDFCKLWEVEIDGRSICKNYKGRENEIS